MHLGGESCGKSKTVIELGDSSSYSKSFLYLRSPTKSAVESDIVNDDMLPNLNIHHASWSMASEEVD